MRIEIAFDKYKLGKGRGWEEDGEGVASLEYQVDSVEDETSNHWVMELDGKLYYFNAQDVRNAVKFLEGVAPK